LPKIKICFTFHNIQIKERLTAAFMPTITESMLWIKSQKQAKPAFAALRPQVSSVGCLLAEHHLQRAIDPHHSNFK
jgi:hypothetical protein